MRMPTTDQFVILFLLPVSNAAVKDHDQFLYVLGGIVWATYVVLLLLPHKEGGRG